METHSPASNATSSSEARNYPAVYWFWHRVPTREEIETQLAEIKQGGYRIFFIQPRLAFPRYEYLGVGYLQAYRTALETAARFGLTAGLYDDYNWISGHAGGRSVAGHDDLRERQLFWSQGRVQNGRAEGRISGIHNRLGDGLGNAFQQWVYEGGQAKWADWQVIRAYACPVSGEPVDVTAFCQVLSAADDRCDMALELPQERAAALDGARVIFFPAARCHTSRLVNLLHPRAARRFIEAGYEPYAQTVGDFFGNTLEYLFIDQPYTGFYTWNEHFSDVLNSLMFDESLLEEFVDEHGYDMGKALLALVLDEDQKSPRLRCDFFETYGRLARSRFLAPLADWAHEHGLKFTGHELLSFVGGWGFADGLQGIDARVNFGADFFSVDEYKDVSAVDACNYHAQVSARMGNSVARAHGRQGCFVEQYSVPVGRNLPAPAGQWDLSLADVRNQAIRHTLMGADTFIFHAFYQTNEIGLAVEPLESPRFDFPPGINFEPWFRFHPRFAEELANLNRLLADVQVQSRTALLYPLRTYWHEGARGAFNPESAFWNRWLTEHGIQYDVIDEGQVQADSLQQAGYRLLILPGVCVVKDEQFYTEVERFVENGGCLIASGPLPAATQQMGRCAGLEMRMATLLASHARTRRYLNGKEAGQDAGLPEWVNSIHNGLLIEALDDSIDPLFIRQGATTSGGLAAAVFNDSPAERRLSVSAESREGVFWQPERWYPTGGEHMYWPCFDRKAGHTRLDLRLQPYELACIRFNPVAAEDLPFVRRVQGSCVVETASMDEAGQLRAALRCDQSGLVRLSVHSAQEPRISPPEMVRTIRPLPAGEWEIELEIPPLPEKRILKNGWTLRLPQDIKPKPVALDAGWEKYSPYHAGAGFYQAFVDLGADARTCQWELYCPSVHTAMTVYVNQALAGVCGWPPYRLTLPEKALKPAYNELQIAVWNTAGNAFYKDTPYQRSSPMPSGLDQIPELHPFIRIWVTAS